MATLNAANSSIALDVRKESFINANLGDVASSPVTGSTQFSEVYSAGFRMNYTGSFSNYAEDNEYGTLAPETAIINQIDATLNGGPIYSLSGIAHNPMNYRGQSNETKNLAMLSGNDQIIGSSLGDYLAGGAGNDNIDGGGGIDTVKFSQNKGSYSLGQSGSNFIVSGTTEGQDTLTNVERLQFQDRKVAIDVAGNALKTLQFISVVAPKLSADFSVRGAILSIFDQGHSLFSLSQVALNVNLLPKNNAELVNTVYQNLFNTLPDQNLSDALQQYALAHGQAKLIADIAALSLNIDLVGLQQNGMEYL